MIAGQVARQQVLPEPLRTSQPPHVDDSEVDEPGGRPEGLRVEQLLELVAARAQAAAVTTSPGHPQTEKALATAAELHNQA